MITISLRLLRDKFVSFLSYTIGGILLIILYIVTLPTVQASQAQMAELIKNMPEALLKAFGITGVDLNSLEALLAMKQFNLVWPLLLIFLVVSIAGSVIAGEIENRTIEITLASAKNRIIIFIAKYLAGAVYMTAFTIITILCTIPLAIIFGYEYQAQNYFTLTYLSLAFGFAVLGLSFLLSSIFSSKGRVYAISGLIYTAMYVLFIITTLKDSLKNFQYGSFFYYYNYNDALLRNDLDNLAVVVFVAAGLVTSIIALIIFLERDIAV